MLSIPIHIGIGLSSCTNISVGVCHRHHARLFIRKIYALFFAQPADGITSNAERDHIILYQTSRRTSLTDDIDLPDADYMLERI